MRKRYLYLIFIFCISCQTNPYQGSMPRFSYMDSLRTAKKINCASKAPLDCMACALQGEAANQTADGIYAVGVTIMTRAKGNVERICKVTKARGQFEGMRRRGHRKISKKVWEVSQFVLEKKETGWTHFWAPREQANLRRSKPSWAHSFEQRQCHKEKIDDHIFYNKNKCSMKQSRQNASN